MPVAPNAFLRTAVVVFNVIGVWDAYLMLRQRRADAEGQLPEYFKDDVTNEEFVKAQSYQTEKSTFGIISHVKGLVLQNIGFLLQLPARLYYRVAERTGLPVASFSHNFAAAVAGDLIATAIELPFSYYQHFHLEARHGFNKMTKTEFVKDTVKFFLLRVTLLYPLQIKLTQYVVQRFGARFPLYFFLGASAMFAVMLVTVPTVFMPLFNTFTPLDTTSSLYKSIETLSQRLKFPLKRVYVVDGSRRSHHSNAYLYGLGASKRIVLYDTLIEQMKGDEEAIVGVLCHELGHWKHSHMYGSLAATLAQLLVISWGAALVVFNKSAYEAFGFRNADPVVGFSLFMENFYAPVSTFVGYGFCYRSRCNEFQADRFAVDQGHGEALRRALRVTAKENKTGLTPDPLYSALNHTHPPMLERLQAVDEAIKKQA